MKFMFVHADKESGILDAKKKINKANYIIQFLEHDTVFGLVKKGFYIPNKKLLKEIVKQYNIDTELLIYGYDDKKYSVYRLKWCI